MNYSIELTEEETKLLSDVDLDQSNLDYEKCGRQGPVVLQLLKSLYERDAIPDSRLSYWADPEYNIGRMKTSHKGIFEKNGVQGEAIYTHPHFLEYLRYFLFGAELPHSAIFEFEKLVGDPKMISSGDVTGIVKGTRSTVRRHGLQSKYEEFYRLALDVRLDLSIAKAVRDTVKRS